MDDASKEIVNDIIKTATKAMTALSGGIMEPLLLNFLFITMMAPPVGSSQQEMVGIRFVGNKP